MGRICLLYKTNTPSYSSRRLQRCTSTIPASTPSLSTPTSRRGWSRSPCPTWSTRPNGQFGEAQFPVPHHGGRVCEDPEGAGGPAEEDQLPQRGGEQQPDGDEA